MNLPNKLRDYTYDKDNMPRMETEVVYVRVRHLSEAAARIEQLEKALRGLVGAVADHTSQKSIPDALKEARAALEEKA